MGDLARSAPQLTTEGHIPACPACGGLRRGTTAFAQEGPVRRCPDCGTGATDPRPSPEALDAVYSGAYYGADNVKFTPNIERLRSVAVLRRARWIDRQVGRRGRILEIGCGPGALLAAMAGLGHECHGTERSELAAVGAKRVEGSPSTRSRSKSAASPPARSTPPSCGTSSNISKTHRWCSLQLRELLRPGGC